jgi:hypothetical protein
MNTTKDAVFNHLAMKTNGALMITGDWGSGKTYYIKNVLFPAVEAEGKFLPILVSVYGDKDKTEIAEKLVFAWGQKKAGNDKVAAVVEAITKLGTKVAEAVPALKKWVDLEKLLANNGDNLLKILPHNKLLICFDDVERMSDKLPINDFLGMINELVENIGAKVLIIANDKKFKKIDADSKKETVLYLEKTVEKTVHYTPDMSDVLNNIIASYDNADFKKHLVKHKTWLIQSLHVDVTDREELKTLKEELSNIRTLKFAIEHFRLAFETISAQRDVTNDLVDKQLQSIWLFTLAVANEFKKGTTISYADRWKLDELETSFPNFDLSQFINLENVDDDKKQEDDPKDRFKSKFKQFYYQRINENYIFYQEVFNLITGGQAINSVTFLNEVDEKFYVQDGKVNHAQELLSRFTSQGYFSFSNEEFHTQLYQLFDFVVKGKLENVKSYLDAGAAFFYFNEFLGKPEAEIIAAVKSGLKQIMQDVEFGHGVRAQFDMMEANLSEPKLKEIFSYIRQLANEIAANKEKELIAQLNEWVKTDPEKFINFFIPEPSTIRTPFQPILDQIDLDNFQEHLPKWQPKAIALLRSMIETRYYEAGFVDRLINEMPFLNSIAALNEQNITEANLTRFTILRLLLPETNKAIKTLERYIPKVTTGIAIEQRREI